MHAYPKLAARIPAFLQNRRQDVVTMLDALTRGDFETVERLGHDMKGAGASFGFQAITDIGAALEQKAESADTDASRKWVGELSTYLDGVGYGAEVAVATSAPRHQRAMADARCDGRRRPEMRAGSCSSRTTTTCVRAFAQFSRISGTT